MQLLKVLWREQGASNHRGSFYNNLGSSRLYSQPSRMNINSRSNGGKDSLYLNVRRGILAILVLWSSETHAAAGTTSISKEPFKMFIKSCQLESGATRADLEAIKMRKLPDTKSGRCFLECLFTKAKLMDNGKFNKLGMVIALTPSTKGDSAKLRQVKELAEVCDREIGGKSPGNCEGVKLVVECVARHGKEYGVEFSRPKNS
ncbi:hypothetical protein NQ318_009786 [Aromia moschata]|uniref:Uncharacterized protein n=1 Tax=Aromia moschata TaxID=1265417 RepID=A0AAV8Y7J9_9CUCU|nr:hypothetical protein NQ318_009786 [Aromia moschata]